MTPNIFYRHTDKRLSQNAYSRAIEMKTKLALFALIGISATAAVNVAMPKAALAQRNQSADSLYRGAHTIHGKTVIIPIGVHFEGRIDHTIGSSCSKPGERFEVEVSSPVLANGTDVLIPAGSAVVGEVVECIPSSKLPHQKGFPKPTGQLRVQLSGLRTPDGVTYPMVASLAGETQAQAGGRGRRGAERANTRLGHGVAYVGTTAGFEAVAPGATQRFRTRPGQPPKVVSPQEIMRDPIYGSGQAGSQTSGISHVRSLVKRNYNLWILAGSPLSIRIDAPFKMGIAPAAGSAAVLDAPMDDPDRIHAGVVTGRYPLNIFLANRSGLQFGIGLTAHRYSGEANVLQVRFMEAVAVGVPADIRVKPVEPLVNAIIGALANAFYFFAVLDADNVVDVHRGMDALL